MTDSNLSLHGVVALELRPGTHAARSHFDQAAAGHWAGLLAQDLSRLLPGAEALDLAVLGAHFDPTELLRPGWPRHAELELLLARAPRQGLDSRVLAIGSDIDLPATLRPDPALAAGHFRLLPFVLRGDAAAARRVGEAMETRLLETGMLQAATALAAQDGLGCAIEHARVMSLHDVLAMQALQYEHAGLGRLWPLIETALLRPQEDSWLDAKPEPLLCYRDGEAHLALMDHDVWFANGFAMEVQDAEKAERLFGFYEQRVRQIAALLEAHGVPVLFEHVAQGQAPREVLVA